MQNQLHDVESSPGKTPPKHLGSSTLWDTSKFIRRAHSSHSFALLSLPRGHDLHRQQLTLLVSLGTPPPFRLCSQTQTLDYYCRPGIQQLAFSSSMTPECISMQLGRFTKSKLNFPDHSMSSKVWMLPSSRMGWRNLSVSPRYWT